MTDQQLTHIDEQGDVRMVDVSHKADTERVAVAEGFISMKPETLALIVEGKAAKGDVLACARVAGVMAAKQTSALIPMCNPDVYKRQMRGSALTSRRQFIGAARHIYPPTGINFL